MASTDEKQPTADDRGNACKGDRNCTDLVGIASLARDRHVRLAAAVVSPVEERDGAVASEHGGNEHESEPDQQCDRTVQPVPVAYAGAVIEPGQRYRVGIPYRATTSSIVAQSRLSKKASM